MEAQLRTSAMKPKAVNRGGFYYRILANGAGVPGAVEAIASVAQRIDVTVVPENQRGFTVINGKRVYTNNPFRYNVLETGAWDFDSFQNRLNGTLSSKHWGKQTTIDVQFPSWDRTMLYNMALERLNSAVRGNLDLSVAIGEARTTARMVRGLRDVVTFAKNLRTSKGLANGWLQWQYGWRPLMLDIYGAANEARRIVSNELKDVTGSATLPLFGRAGLSYVISPYGIVAAAKQTAKGKQGCKIHIQIDPTVTDASRWTSLNPVSIAWELIPYSFVVDWFYDVGSGLRNLETALLYKSNFVKGYVSELYTCSVEEAAGSVVYRNIYGDTAYLKYGTRDARKVNFERTVLASYPFPRKPTFNVDLGSRQMLSAAALLRQILDKRSRRSAVSLARGPDRTRSLYVDQSRSIGAQLRTMGRAIKSMRPKVAVDKRMFKPLV